MTWSTFALMWVLCGTAWILIQLRMFRSISSGEFWTAVFCVIAGPVSVVIYGASYVVHRVRNRQKKSK